MNGGVSLFRPEALVAQAQAGQGSVQLVRPLSLAWLTALALLAVLAVLAFLALAQYTRRSTIQGVLVPDQGLIRLVPTAAGAVLERRVREGQSVAAGEVLFVLALDRSRLAAGAEGEVRRSLEQRQRSLSDAATQQHSLAHTRRAALDRRLAALREERAQIEAEAALQAQRLVLAQSAHTRLRALEAEQFISSAQVQAKSEDLLALRAAAQSLLRQRTALDRERAELEGERHALPLVAQGAASSLERDQAQLARESAELDAERHIVVRAPQAGTMSGVLAQVGQSVAPGAALASLVPEGAQLQAQLFAPSSAVGFVQPGQAVQLRYEAFPYQKFGHRAARVLEVSRVPLAASELSSLALPTSITRGAAAGDGGGVAAAAGEALFRITVSLDPQTPAQQGLPLVAGMRLAGDILLERRRLLEWLLEPLLAWRERH
jgi:membrane fusion protein